MTPDFYSTKLEEERAKDPGKVFTIRLNDDDLVWVNELKEIFDVKSEGTILKLSARNYLHVLHHNFSPRYLRYLFKKDRKRLSDFKAFNQEFKPKSNTNP